MSATGPELLVQDPYRPYAVRFIELFARRYGMRTVAFYTDPVQMRRHRQEFPQLYGPLISASYLVDESQLDAFASMLRERHRIEAVVPYWEATLLPAARIAERIGLSWAQPGVIERFRDKAALKDHLRSVPGGPRMNVSAHVSSLDEVRALVADHGLDRYVLKPNDGFGNQLIGFFDSSTSAQQLAAYVAAVGTDLVLEEYVDGPELFVDGIVDERGEPTSWSVWRYLRLDANGRHGVCIGAVQVRRHDPLFAPAVEYADHVMRASGLRRNPFHLELKVDDRGPCLIEVAGRLPGADYATLDGELHGTLDVFGVAAHHYLSDEPYGEIELDWDRYDATVRGQVNGISTVSGRVFEVLGREEAESSPEFVRWVAAPEFGNRVEPTVDFLTEPWRMVVDVPDETAYDEVSERMRALVRVNASDDGLRPLVGRYAALAPAVAREARSYLPRGGKPRPFDQI